MARHLRRAALMMHSFPWTAKPFQMAADENDPKGSRVDDPEFKALAKSIAIADMLCISMIASSLYKISEKQSPRLANSYDPWNEAPDYSSQAIQNLRQWPHAINAYKENVSLSEWLSVYDGAHPHRPAANLDNDHEYYIHEIVDITDDNWARQWDPIIGQIASDYNDIRYGYARSHFHWHYLKNAKYGELWRELFTAAVRLMGPNLYGDVVTKLETIKTSINAAASVLEGLVVGLIREVDDAIISAVKLRVIALGAVCEQVNARYQSVGSDGYWNTRLWQHNWAKSETRIRDAIQYHQDKQNKHARVTATFSRMASSQSPISGTVTLQALTGLAVVAASLPGMMGWSLSQLEPGSIDDADFWWLLTSTVFQLLALTTFVISMAGLRPMHGSSRRWVWIYLAAGLAFTMTPIPLYLWVSVRYSSAAAFLGNVAVAFVHIQMSLMLLSQQPNIKQE